MAVIGDILKEPELNWKRIDDTDLRIKFEGSWARLASSVENYNKTAMGCRKGGLNSTCSFSFKGTGLNVIGMSATSYTDEIEITIDDTVETFSAKKDASPNVGQVLLYQKKDLENKIHNVTIKNIKASSNAATYDFRIDAFDIENGDFINSIGFPLPQPENGYQRIDDSDQKISFIGNWERYTDSSDYNGSSMRLSGKSIGSMCKFRFFGTSFILLGLTGKTYTDRIKIEVDGIEDYFSSVSPSNQYNAILYRKDNLPLDKHTVTITHVQNSSNINIYEFAIDAIDIENNGYLLGTEVYIPVNFNGVQVISSEYEKDSIIRKDYIGTLEECSLATLSVLENSNKVSNNSVKDINIRTVSDDKFILE